MRPARSLFIAHLLAISFALGGLLIALPHPELWNRSRYAPTVFNFGMHFSGSLHILFGAATMLAFGSYWLGRRRTFTFFAAATLISLTSESIGTRTGWPFGNYAYTSGLGYKILGRVPFTIPLSWFYVGFTAFLLGSLLASRFPRHRAAWSVALGAYLLTVWDLVLDPAMASTRLPAQFWVWSQRGPYFGMPVKNFIGWTLTGIVFMAVARYCWRRDAAPGTFPAWLPVGMYLANTIFAMALSLSVGLWQPAVAAILFGWLPALLAYRIGRGEPRRQPREPGVPVTPWIMRRGAGLLVTRQLRLEVEGLERVPADGPVLLAAHHVHHLYDGLGLLATVERPLHILVALDWAHGSTQRRLMEFLCRLAGWPVVLREDALARGVAGANDPAEVRAVSRRGVRQAVDLLRAGATLVVFPEAYPGVDPHYTPKQRADEFLPFRPGFVRLAQLAARTGAGPVAVVPVGVAWSPAERRLALRFGQPLAVAPGRDPAELARLVEEQVRLLSGAAVVPSVVDEAVPGAAPRVAKA